MMKRANTALHPHNDRRYHRLSLSFVLTTLLMFGALGQAHASSAAICRGWYKQQKYLDASRCFLGIYEQLKQISPRTEDQNEQMGAALRNVGLIMRKAAELEKDRARAAYLRERSVAYLTAFIKGKHYTSNTQRAYTIVQRDSTRELIGYATLTILSHPQSQIRLLGYKYEAHGKGRWTGRVRPGKFAIFVKHQGRTIARELHVPPNDPKVVRLMPARGVVRRDVKAAQQRPTPAQQRPLARPQVRQAPQPRILVRNPLPRRPLPAPSLQKTRILPWIILGVGVAIAAAGGVLTGVAFMARGQRDTKLIAAAQKSQSERSYQSDTLAIGSLHRDANTYLMAGIIAGGVGVSAMSVGFLLFGLAPKNQQPQANRVPVASKTLAPLP